MCLKERGMKRIARLPGLARLLVLAVGLLVAACGDGGGGAPAY